MHAVFVFSITEFASDTVTAITLSSGHEQASLGLKLLQKSDRMHYTMPDPLHTQRIYTYVSPSHPPSSPLHSHLIPLSLSPISWKTVWELFLDLKVFLPPAPVKNHIAPTHRPRIIRKKRSRVHSLLMLCLSLKGFYSSRMGGSYSQCQLTLLKVM